MTVKNFLFCVFIFPNAVFVTSLFWFVYHVDRELTFPEEYDKYVASWQNHMVHTFILVPAIAELIQEGKRIRFPDYKIAALTLNMYGLVYHIMLVCMHFAHFT